MRSGFGSQGCLFLFAVFVHASDFVGELLLVLEDVFVFAGGEGFVDLPFEEEFVLGDFGFGGGFEVGDGGFLRGGEGAGGCLFFEAFHGEFVGAFHRGRKLCVEG